MHDRQASEDHPPQTARETDLAGWRGPLGPSGALLSPQQDGTRQRPAVGPAPQCPRLRVAAGAAGAVSLCALGRPSGLWSPSTLAARSPHCPGRPPCLSPRVPCSVSSRTPGGARHAPRQTLAAKDPGTACRAHPRGHALCWLVPVARLGTAAPDSTPSLRGLAPGNADAAARSPEPGRGWGQLQGPRGRTRLSGWSVTPSSQSWTVRCRRRHGKAAPANQPLPAGAAGASCGPERCSPDRTPEASSSVDFPAVN